MSILDRLKSLFNKNRKALPEPQMQYENNRNTPNNTYFLPRRDGSTLEITPVLDDLGYPSYEQVYNSRTQQSQAIPKFIIMSEELKTLIRPEILGHTVLMDIDYNQLNNPEYADAVANKLLSAQRMEKVVSEYGNYAGTLKRHENGNFEKIIDQGIVKTLNSTQKENAMRIEKNRLDRYNSERENIINKAQNIKVHEKDSHAENLSGKEFDR